MDLDRQLLFLVSALGAFNGIILSVYLFLSKKRRSVASFFLGLLLLAFSIRVAKSVFLYFNPGLPKICLQIGLSACFLIGPSLYYFFKAVLLKSTGIPNSWKWSWGIQLGALVLVGMLFPYQTRPDVWNNIIVYVIYLQWPCYLVATGFLLKPVLKTLFVNPSVLSDTEKFWLILFLGNCLIFLAYLLAFFRVVHGIYISGGICFTFMLFLTVFFSLSGAGFENNGKPERKKIAETDASIWLDKLEKVIRDKALYKDPNLKLNDLAQHINISMHQLSQLLNDNLGKSFSTYINEYRIAEACKLITTNERLTFEAIGYEVGYNSKSTFYAAFRKIKDMTPALYKESIGAA
ncbi:helix-turn-helix domain-containing protein [Chitinophaga niabensis]|uniref:AraC-type DNA-binding protein n=1 Tax=Chitinophaga niabensis TaxID=536979 RepID=A0A1N6FLU0_9BACT|nr:helix-turn-helix domain-containing protein [Chitinophaga niabensis]SIN96253.1 AraC-type DNA-binding protein [Chitinophaga niabensis]